MCHKKHLVKSFRHPDNRATKHELVFNPEGVVITKIVVSYNRSITKGHSRARFYHPDCEFVVGQPPQIRKYPDIRPSVWGDHPQSSDYEWWGCPPTVPKIVTDEYPEIAPANKRQRHATTVRSKNRAESEDVYTLDSSSSESPSEYSYSESNSDMQNLSSALKKIHGERGASAIDSEEDEDEDRDDDDDMSEYHSGSKEDDAKAFMQLEKEWQQETDILLKEELYTQVQRAEVKYCVKHGVYDRVIGNTTKPSFAKTKTRSRMRNRLKRNRCLGLPTALDTLPTRRNEKKKKWPKERVDPKTSLTISFSAFKKRERKLSKYEQMELWRTFKRRKKEPRGRLYKDEIITWSECVDRWAFEYEMSRLYTWFQELEKVQ